MNSTVLEWYRVILNVTGTASFVLGTVPSPSGLVEVIWAQHGSFENFTIPALSCTELNSVATHKRYGMDMQLER